MKVKRKVAALLALAMVVTGQPSGVLADGLNTLGTSYAAENSDVATGSEATDPTEPEKPELPEEELPEESTGAAEEPSKPEEETPTEEVTEEETEETKEETEPTEEEEDAVYSVSYTVEPKGSAEIKGKEEVKEGKDLTFKVYPEEGYEIESVEVNGEEVTDSKEKKSFLFFFGDTYYEYKVQDVEEDLDIAAYLKPELTAEDGDTEVMIQAEDADVLKNVVSVEIADLGQDEAVEAALKEQLDGKTIVDYKAIDITLYNEDGEEVQPKGEVSVAINGVSTDEDYDEVAIFHLQEPENVQEQQNVRRPMRAPAANGISVLSEEEQPQAYVAEEVTKGVNDRTEKDNAVSFKTDHFSTYVVVFVKDGNKTVNFHLMDAETKQELDYTVDEDVLGIGNETINIEALLQGNGLDTISVSEKEYVFQKATNDIDGNNIIDQINYATIDDNVDFYIWYQNIESLKISVKVDLINENNKTTSYDGFITPGEIDKEKETEVLNSISSEVDTTGYAFKTAEVYSTSYEGVKEKIVNITQIGKTRYVKLADGRDIALDNQEIHFTYEKGIAVNISIKTEGEPNENNTVAGEDKGGNGNITLYYLENESISIPVNLEQGYNVLIKQNKEPLYDSSVEETQIRTYNINIPKLEAAQSFEVKFIKIEQLELDLSFIAEHNTSGDRFHSSTVYVGNSKFTNYGENNQEVFPINEFDAENGYNITIKIEQKSTKYGMDSLAVNGQPMDVPNDNELHSGLPQGLSEENSILDQSGKPIANLKITAKKDRYGYRTYTLEFTQVTGNLEITGGNLKDVSLHELLYSDDTEGVKAVYKGSTANNPWEIGDQHSFSQHGSDVDIFYEPEIGYYISDVTVNGQTVGSLDGTSWYEIRNKHFNKNDEIVQGNLN